MDAKTALFVIDLKKSYQPDFYKKPIQVLKGIEFSIQEGAFVGLIGPNGAGKTTTIKCLMGFANPDQGQIKFFGSPDLVESKKRIGFLPERPYFHEFLTGLEFLKLQWKLSGIKDSKDMSFETRSLEVLDLVKLTHAKDKKISSYSKGMMQRIGIAQALLVKPDFLILDEPMSGLDPDGRILVKDILKNLKQLKLTVLMSSHLLEDIEELCEDLIVIHEGKTFFSGRLENFKKDFVNLEDAYRSFKNQFKKDLNV